ncbi:MAG: tetratricopeptide (TPR) repeat protein [Bradymonadia bacterium]|jgi:tetratricopeptide (TPR) repeat protein
MMRFSWRVSSILVALALVACGGSQASTVGVSTPANETAPSIERDTADTSGTTAEVTGASASVDVASRFNEAMSVAISGDTQDALARLLALAEEQPDLADVWFNIGVLRAETSDYGGAATAFQRAIEAEPEHGPALANLGFLQMSREAYTEALSTFERCIVVEESEPGCNINLAILYRMGFGNVEGDSSSAAIERLRFALGGDPQSAAAYELLARVYSETGRLELARLVCENAILLGIEDAVLHNRLGLIALELDEVGAAYREFQAAVAIDPALIEAQMNIAAMALSFRDYESALSALQLVRVARPSDLEVRLSYGVALRGLDELDAAKLEYDAVLGSEPGHLGALYNLGILQQEGFADYAAACGHYREFLSAPGASSAAKYDDVELRLGSLGDLLSALAEMGQVDPTVAAACQ